MKLEVWVLLKRKWQKDKWEGKYLPFLAGRPIALILLFLLLLFYFIYLF